MWRFIIAFLLLALAIICIDATVCQSALTVKTICSLSTLPILNILPAVRSRLECAVACSQDTACKSSLFDSFGVCRTFSDYSTFEQCASEDFYFPVFESWCHVPPIIPGEIFSYCENDTQCVLVPGSACRNSHQGFKCQCVPGLSYDPVTNECVTACTNYGTTFQADLDYLVVGFADKSVPYTDLQACKDACVAETSFVCRSIEIWKTGGVCYLSTDTAWTQPQAREANVDYDLYQRDCAP